MKRFEVVIDLSKQLISLSTALIGGAVVVSQWLFEFMNQANVFLSFIAALFFWGLSIILGVFNIGATINLIETQEFQSNKAVKKIISMPNQRPRFVSVFESTLGPKFGLFQQLTFLFGVCSFCAAFLFDKF